MSVLAFSLGLIAVGAALATFTAIVAAVIATASSLLPLSAARRADLFFLLGLAPGLIGVLGMVLVALPSVLAGVGLVADHCLSHDHHIHLCPVHIAGLPAAVAAVAGGVFVVAVLRLGTRLLHLVQQRKLVRAAICIGERSSIEGTTVVTIAGPPTLLHAGDDLILASRTLLQGLSYRARRAALAHETAHVRRGDPRCLSLLSLAAAWTPPLFGELMVRAFRQAAEEAADEDAAAIVGVLDVADAVIEVSRLRLRTALDGLCAVDGADIERRIHRLLALQPRPRRSGAVVVVALLMGASLASVPLFADVHHVAESALAHVVTRPVHH